MEINKIIQGDCLDVLKTFDNESIDCCITSPPYWGLRDYGVDGQLGLEKTPEEYVAKMVEVFREVKRCLKKEGTLWLNLWDTYYNFRGYTDYSTKQSCASNEAHVMKSACGKRNAKQDNLKGKDLVGIPWMTAFALRADGWYLRQDIIWAKPNPMPESVTDRCTKSHEYIFLLSKSARYYYDNEAVKEPYASEAEPPRDRSSEGYNESFTGGRWSAGTRDYYANGGRNKRDVWTVTTKPFKEAHFATFPEDLIIPMVKAGCPKGGVVLDPFMGAGTTAVVAKKLDRNYLGIELNQKYIDIAEKRIKNVPAKLF